MPTLSKVKQQQAVESPKTNSNKNSSSKNSSSKNHRSSNSSNSNHRSPSASLTASPARTRSTAVSVASPSLDTSRMTSASLPHPATAVRPRIWTAATSPGGASSSVASTSSSPLSGTTTTTTTTSVLVHKTTPSLSQYATKSITKHYEINSQILAAFESSYDARRYHVAYAMGMQFVETALLEIPKHGYFYSPRHERERMQSSLDAVRVATLLQEIQQQAWSQDQIRLQEYEKMQKLKALAVEQVERASEDQYEAQRAKAEREIRNKPSSYASSFFTSTTASARQQQQQQQQQQQSSGIYNDSSKGSSSSKRTSSFKKLFGRRGKSSTKTTDSSTSYNNDNNNNNTNNMSSNNTTATSDSADSWIVLDDWMCPESLTNVLCPAHSHHHAPTVAAVPTSPVVLPLPVSSATPEPKSPVARKERVKTTTSTPEREAALSTMPIDLAVDLQRSRTAPPGGRTRKPPSAANTTVVPAVHPDQQQSYHHAYPEQREQQQQQQPQYQHYANNTTMITAMQPPRLERHDYRDTMDEQPPLMDQQQFLSQDWQMVNGNYENNNIIPFTQHVRQHSADEILLERALYLSGLEIAPAHPPPLRGGIVSDSQYAQSIPENEIMTHGVVAASTAAAAAQPVDVDAAEVLVMSNKRLELATLKQLYHEDFDQLRREGRIRVAFADTYQGRLTESTNGCTVIAPLLCMHHLLEDDDNGGGGNGGGDVMLPDPGLPDHGIIQVIDKETPAILNELRTSLGLSEQAFLIPADVHDYLIENGQLHQSQFVNVVGGNILDEAHLQNLFQALEEDNVAQQNVNNGQGRLAATLFFHEHVVAILKLRREPPAKDSFSSSITPTLLLPHSPHSPATTPTRLANKGNTKSEFWYDLIDSLPLKDTLTRVDESEVEFSRRLGLSESDEELSQAFLPMTARIRCLDAESMRMCIRWYACSKFTPENCQFIDTYEWDDAQSDFDPRVFQAFIWGSA